MPATSKEQKTMACMALAMKRGKMEKSFSKRAAEMMESMSEADLKDFCESPVEMMKSSEKMMEE